MRVTNTEGLLRLARDAKGRNRSVYTNKLIEAIDPHGAHVMVFSMVHNDCEIRTQWYVKLKDQDEPEAIWLDVSFKAYENSTVEYEPDAQGEGS